MIRIPLLVVFAIVALNITAFAALLQMDLLIFHSTPAKLIAWLLAAGTWSLAYAYKRESYVIRLK